ncbi:hypothetical protein EW145_g7068 [Phellinidium pouzarii]|uniref:Uncharacterized protein n=1 Tax=Phellinidium pouzarii TaxID=167371 RepID=A0A4S4KPH6_9AGAM|nr:hypothetical protein EW145_g7068 [Phellinidium pouzarii]
MCLGNRAESSSHYINSQLRALYENAVKCTENHGTGFKPSESAVEYSTCLYEFYGPGKHSRAARRDLPFFATFGCPRIEFVCNHEVILFLDIQEGHLNLDFNKKHEHLEMIDKCTIAFRITFSTHPIVIDKIQCPTIGNAANYTMILHVLDMSSAIFVPEHSDVPEIASIPDERGYSTKESKLTGLTHYLTKFYLPTLKRAGHHVLYSLPDFDNLASTTAHTDYSVISKRTLSTDALFGVRVEEVNTFLRGLWLQAAAFIDEYGLSADTVSKSLLAELHTPLMNGPDDMNLHLHFGPLYVQPLCKREVVLYLDIQDIYVHMGGFHVKASHILTDCKIAFIIDIIFEEIDDGSTRRIKLDLSTARYCEHLSVFSEQVDVNIKRTLIHHITTYYLSVLDTSETNIIFHRNNRIHVDIFAGDGSGSEYEDDDDCLYECTCKDETACGHSGIRWGVLYQRLITHTHTHDFDFVNSLTQGSINAHFRELWNLGCRRLIVGGKKLKTWESSEIEMETCLADFSFVHPEHGDEIFFSSSFAPPKVQLVCKEGSYSVIFYLHLNQGYLKTLGTGKALQPGSQEHPFAGWRLAFEVDLRLIESTDEAVPNTIRNPAKFNLNLSTVPGLLDGKDYRNIRARREALIYYIQTCYFPVFKRAHHHVLYTIPILDKAGSDLYRFTSLDFQIVPFNHGHGHLYFEGLHGRHRAIFDRNSVVIVGMTDGRTLHTYGLPRDINWVGGVGSEVPLGTVCFSRRMFLEAKLLTMFEHVNRKTTIVPMFLGVDNGEWILKLTTWDKHEIKAQEKCKWREVAAGEDSLDFEWKNKEEWSYVHEGDSDHDHNDHYTLSCTTRNVLSIPTRRQDTSVINFKGSMTLGLSYVGKSKDWSAKMSATWSANIILISIGSGLQVNLSPSHIVPHFTSPPFTNVSDQGHEHGHATLEKAFYHLKNQFPASIDFAPLVGALKDGLEGAWAGAHVSAHELCMRRPVFTRRGDLLLELAVRVPHTGGMVINVNGGSAARGALGAKRRFLGLTGGVVGINGHLNGHADGHANGDGTSQII